MAVKSKLARSKKNNQQRNKVKQGIVKKGINKNPYQGGSNKIKKKPPPKIVRNTAPKEDSEDSDHGEDMLGMVDKDDLDFLKNAVSNRSYSILNRVKYSGPTAKRRRPNENDDETLENNYEDQIEDTSNQTIRNLLPIKTKSGLITRQMVEEDKNENDVEEDEGVVGDQNEVEDDEEMGEFTLEDNNIDISKPISATQMLVHRNEVLRQRKIAIGTLSAGLLENPEEKVSNLRNLLKIMDEDSPEVYFTVRKLVIVSLLEIFKDILPSYEIKNVASDGVKLKKDTLKLKKYEENLLLYYKKFLQKLEKHCFLLVKKKGDSRKRSEEDIKLAELSIQAMCSLLETHPYFNYGQNIAQVMVPFLNNPNKNIRETVKSSVKTIFKEDKKEEITLKILRIINNYLKTHTHNTHTDMLEVLLVLKLRDVNLDQEKENDIRDKKMKAQKAKILQMSKKERKRKKKLQTLEQEMLETKAEESQQIKQKNLTEITKIIFNIYFRILKNSNNSKVLGVCLEGLAKFSHCINLEYYVDIVNVLDCILKENWLGFREKLHCVLTIFNMLSGQGEALNLDPSRFYNILYKDLLITNAAKANGGFDVLLQTLTEALVKRRKKVTSKRVVSFVKRLATLSLQLVHNESLGCLGTIRTLMQLNRSVDILLDTENSFGDGKYQAEIDDPEYANASSTAVYETVLLSKHYHPVVGKFARYIASGVPTSGEGSLPIEYGKMNAEELFTDFDMSEMAFNPPVPIPRKVQPKSRPKRFTFSDRAFETHCKDVLKSRKRSSFWINY